MLSFAACYDAMARRDPAVDGLFFVAVRTTKIYCRPVCRARLPLAKNIRLYPSAAAAERAGYRPCLRCRPETESGDPPNAGRASANSDPAGEREFHLARVRSLRRGSCPRRIFRPGFAAPREIPSCGL